MANLVRSCYESNGVIQSSAKRRGRSKMIIVTTGKSFLLGEDQCATTATVGL